MVLIFTALLVVVTVETFEHQQYRHTVQDNGHVSFPPAIKTQ